MKKLFLLPIFMLFTYCNDIKKTDATTVNDSATTVTEPVVDTVQRESVLEEPNDKPTDQIASIRQRVEYINTANLEKKHYEFMCDEKMTVDYFYDKGEIVKVAVDFGTVGDVYAKEGYYYDKGKLVFNYEFTEGGPACEGCIKTHEYRTYIQNDKAVKYLKDKNVETCRTCEFGAKSRQYKVLKAKTQDEVKAALCR
ncbi:MAG: hypothetical protein ACO1N9_09270 [Flavobacterium sp.]